MRLHLILSKVISDNFLYTPYDAGRDEGTKLDTERNL
jgi:hypothetical protein